MSSSESLGGAAPTSTPKGSWRKTAVVLAAIGAVTVLAYIQPQYAGEAIVGFLGLVGLHNSALS